MTLNLTHWRVSKLAHDIGVGIPAAWTCNWIGHAAEDAAPAPASSKSIGRTAGQRRI